MRYAGNALRGILALTIATGLLSCSEDPDPAEPEAQTGSVEAMVTTSGTALAGVTLRLLAEDGVDALESGNTGANGRIRFDDVEPGAYEVEIVVPAGYELGQGEATRQAVTVVAQQTAQVAFVLSEIQVEPTEGQLRVRVVAGTSGVADVEVMLFEQGGATELETNTTGADGRVLFAALEPGAYEVAITVPEGYELADGGADRREATVTAGATTDVQFAVRSLEEPTVVEIVASGTSFSPEQVTIEPGTTVRWVTPEGGHTVTPAGHDEWVSAALTSAGATFEHTFEEAGEFDYFCIPHQALGMVGSVTVE